MAGYLGNAPTAVPLTSADLADSIITSAKIADGTIVGADINSTFDLTGKTVTGAGGITMADQWRLNANFTGDAAPIASNWERADTDSYGTIGSAMTQSSGIFTFPATGIYLIGFQVAAYFLSAGGSYHTGSIEVTTNNSTYSTASAGDAAGSLYDYQSFMVEFILSVTDTSNVKVRFGIDAVGSQTTLGNTAQQQTGATFIKLGNI